MEAQTFAGWVTPIAEQFRQNRSEAVLLARTLDDKRLAQLTDDTGWSVRDELAHIAGSDVDFIGVLTAVLDGATPDTTIFADIDGRNARNLAARSGQPMGQIASDLESNGEALRALIGRMTDSDETRQPDGFPFPLSGLIQGYAQHEPYHIEQIRKAIAAETK